VGYDEFPRFGKYREGAAEAPQTMHAHAYLACAPRGAGLAAALFYAMRGKDACGWIAHERHAACAAAFFVLRDHGLSAEAVCCRSVGDDPFGSWIEQAVPVTNEVRCPISDADCRELSETRSAFVRTWLFTPDDPLEEEERAAYRKLGLPLRPVNIRSTQFHRFDRNRAVWVHASPGIDLSIVLFVKKRLPLDGRQGRFLS
jgi:hypothetical protein